VADGKLDAFIGNRNSLHDIAAGKLIAREAGATISYLPKSISHNDSETLFIASCTKQLGGALSKICKTL
jgi:fructose-1,6-bisphosphatase/inositol monophosphatase family enzyme